jgi:hypothetical protein
MVGSGRTSRPGRSARRYRRATAGDVAGRDGIEPQHREPLAGDLEDPAPRGFSRSRGDSHDPAKMSTLT